MKKSLLLVTLAIPTSAMALSPTTTIAKAPTEPVKTEIAAEKKEEVKIVDSKLPVPVTGETPEEIKASSSDLKSAGVEIELNSGKIRFKGMIPEFCAEKLSLANVASHDDVKELKNAKISKESDLDAYTKAYKIEVHFAKTPTYKSLKECVDKLKGLPTTALESSLKESHFRDLSLEDKDLATIRFNDDKDKFVIKSSELKKRISDLEKVNCESCSLTSILDETKDNEFLNYARENLFNKSLDGMKDKISKMDSLAQLTETRDQLVEMNKYVTKTAQRDEIIDLMSTLADRNFDVAKSGRRTAREATHHVDFSKETFESIASLEGINVSDKEVFKEKAGMLESHSKDRIQFLSSIDGDHPELRREIERSQMEQQSILAQFQRSCSGQNAQHNFTQCGELQNAFKSNMDMFNLLQNNYAQAHNENWNSIFSRWDNKGISYNPSMKQTVMFPSSGIQPVSSPLSTGFATNSAPMNLGYSDFAQPGMSQMNNQQSQFINLYAPQSMAISPYKMN